MLIAAALRCSHIQATIMPPTEEIVDDRLILAIDVGSSSIRCSAYRMVTSDDDKGSTSSSGVVASVEGCSSSIKVQAVEPNTGKVRIYRKNESGDEECMLDSIDNTVSMTLAKVREKYGASNSTFVVSAVAFSTFVMNLVGIDRDGKPVGNDATMSYACNDPEVAGECEAIRENLRTKEALDAMYQRTGAPLHSAYALPQLRVFYRNNPELARRVTKWATLAGLCLDRWTDGQLRRGGHCSISYSEASWTGMLNFRIGRWDEETKGLLPKECTMALPLPMDFDTSPPTGRGIRILKGSVYWDRWPELRGQADHDDGDADNETTDCRRDDFCRLFLGIGDGACANAGSKCTTLDRIAISVGTSAAVRIILRLPINYMAWGGGAASFVESKGHPTPSIPIPRGLFCYRIDAHHVLLGGALTDGGSVVEWVRSIFQLEDDTVFYEEMKRVEQLYCKQQQEQGEATMHHLSAIPFLSGERSTGFRSGATGVLCGITRETTRGEIIAAMLEGVVLRLNAILQLLIGARKSFKMGDERNELPRIVASGNGLVQNACWMQMLADCSQIDVVVDDETDEATSRGAAFFATLGLRALSIDHPGPERISASSVMLPNANMLAKWKAKSEKQDHLIDGVSSTW